MAEVAIVEPQPIALPVFQPCRTRIEFWRNLEQNNNTVTQPVTPLRRSNTTPVRRHPPVHAPAFISSSRVGRAELNRPQNLVTIVDQIREPEPEWAPEASVKDLRFFFANLQTMSQKKFIRTRDNSRPREIQIQGLSKEFASTLFIDECEICFEKDREGIRLFNCQHEANCCMECIRSYTNQQISTRKEPQCPTCTTEFNLIDICVLQVLGELRKNYLNIYRKMRQERAMAGRSDFFWCPSPNCNNALLREKVSDNNKEITCEKCRVTFCFEHRCPIEHHVCEEWRETIVWVDNNTKRCPNCDTPIEKNGGCPHMTCTCGHEFYWCCLNNHKTDQGRRAHERNCTNPSQFYY